MDTNSKSTPKYVPRKSYRGNPFVMCQECGARCVKKDDGLDMCYKHHPASKAKAYQSSLKYLRSERGRANRRAAAKKHREQKNNEQHIVEPEQDNDSELLTC